MRKLENLFPMFMSSSSFKTKKAVIPFSNKHGISRSQSHHNSNIKKQNPKKVEQDTHKW